MLEKNKQKNNAFEITDPLKYLEQTEKGKVICVFAKGKYLQKWWQNWKPKVPACLAVKCSGYF